MPGYSYVALKNNRTVKGRIEAADLPAARSAIRRMGLVIVKVTEDKGGSSKRKDSSFDGELKKLSLSDKINFTSTLQILTATGTPIIESLAFMEDNAENKNVKQVCGVLKNQIVNGSTLAETMEKNKDAFGRVYSGLTRAGEDSGELDITLARMLELLKKQDATKSKVIGALVYPCLVVVIAVLVFLLLVTFVFPAFEGMFESLGGQLPKVTKICIDMGKFIQKYWYVPPIVFVLIIVSIVFIFKNEKAKKVLDRVVLKLPLVDELIRFANYSNFLAVLQVAYDAGIPVVNCLYLANLTLDNIILRETISSAALKVQQGSGLSTALKETKQIPKMMIFMIATGEQSGRLGEMLHNCTMFIDKKLDDIIERFTKLVEPVMLVVIGAMVLFLALSLYMPLFSAYAQM